MEVEIKLGSKTMACLIQTDTFRSGRTVIDWAYGVNVESIDMSTDFTSWITLKDYEAKKLDRRLKELSRQVSVGLRTNMNKLRRDIQRQLEGVVA